MRVREGGQHLIFDGDQFHSRAGNSFCFGHDRGQGVPDVARGLAHGHQHRPIRPDEAHYPFAGHVAGRDDAQHAGQSGGSLGIQAQHSGPGMVAELDGPMYHAGHTHIVYILVLPQHQRLGLVLGLARAYLAAAGGGAMVSSCRMASAAVRMASITFL